MFVKKYEVESLEDGLKKIKQELGPDALILSTQKKKGTLLGKKSIEITVAIERKKEVSKKSSSQTDEEMLQRVFPHRNQAPKSPSRYIEIQDEPKVESIKTPKRNRFEVDFLRLGISPQSAKELGMRLFSRYPEGLTDGTAAEDRKSKLLQSRLRTLPLERLLEKKALAVIGTPGSGKTSSLVKIGLHLRQNNQPFVLSTLDSRKIVGAIEMQQYSRMLKASVKPFDDMGSLGIQLIDTPSIRLDSEQSNLGLAKKLEAKGAAVLLCLEATHRLSEMFRLIDATQVLFPISAILITKIDLVSQTGFIFDLQSQTDIPVCAVSRSQSFKETIHFPNVEGLSQMILQRGAVS